MADEIEPIHKMTRTNSIPMFPIKNKGHPIGVAFTLVDDIGLEPMTFRTSSGCSSQLS